MESILDRVESSLRDFRPKTARQFAALQICMRFDDLHNLARYVQASQRHAKRVLYEAARLAAKRAAPEGRPAPKLFFELLDQFDQEAS